MKHEELGELLPDRLLVAQNDHLVAQDGVHVSLYHVQFFAD